jgi:hypothetical protein
MNERIQKMMRTYLKLACNGVAQVVEEHEAEVEIIDVDLASSTSLLQERKAQQSSRPLIVLSLQEVLTDDIIYIKKPLEVTKILDALALAREKISNEADTTYNNECVVMEEKEVVTLPPFSMTESRFSSLGVETTLDRQTGLNEKMFLGQPWFCKSLNNRRKTIRYNFQAISGYLKKRSLLGVESDLTALVLIISSKGALVRLNEPLKLGSKVTLDIKFGLKNTFSMPAEVIRENNRNMYGLAFTTHQHGLTDYLINSGRPFKFK